MVEKTVRRPDPIHVDEQGVEWWNWLFTYEFQGAEFGFSICARSKDEALQRLKAMQDAEYDGQQHGNDLSEEEFEAVDMSTVGTQSLN